MHHHPLGPLSLWSSDSALCLYLILLLITPSSDFLKKLNSKNSLVPVFLIGKIGIKTSKNPWSHERNQQRIMCFQGGSFLVIIYWEWWLYHIGSLIFWKQLLRDQRTYLITTERLVPYTHTTLVEICAGWWFFDFINNPSFWVFENLEIQEPLVLVLWKWSKSGLHSLIISKSEDSENFFKKNFWLRVLEINSKSWWFSWKNLQTIKG